MIEKKIVFVLGAGANCSYGFPSGEELKKKCASLVSRSVNSNKQNSFLRLADLKIAEKAEVSKDRCTAFAEALQKCGQLSIDAFLNANLYQNGFEVIGKGAIAQVLLRHEAENISNYQGKYELNDDWLKYLFGEMLDGISSKEQFAAQNNVGFVTFNYDRFLEWWLFDRIRNSFGLNNEAALEILQSIPLYHVYGTLGPFPIADESNDDRPAWINASQSIRTIFDIEQEKSTVEAAKGLIASADTICLCGFGFHRENINLLDLVEFATKCDTIACSRFGITDLEFSRYTRPFTEKQVEIRPSPSHFKCLESIRNLPIF